MTKNVSQLAGPFVLCLVVIFGDGGTGRVAGGILGKEDREWGESVKGRVVGDQNRNGEG